MDDDHADFFFPEADPRQMTDIKNGLKNCGFVEMGCSDGKNKAE
ncbi:hypothetical protein QGN23_11605 [Chryseobacterium gotjawalense]|uniref:Uncharacterized protein n=1 Tax=Chryseobacterium gotjawalense TaxID=3042315 RepID=A0ABY8RAT2_9FLAO|nr:hypothetical protein [Chryseobacterium sp. wdc7]WHF51070.1 hypothetical protein QGN23_11605 [Chryseobacterium sp. wdc7]